MPRALSTQAEEKSRQYIDNIVSIYCEQSQDMWELINHKSQEHELCHQKIWVPILALLFPILVTL